MKTWAVALITAVCLLAGGCRTNTEIVLLERQNRMLEDEVYRCAGSSTTTAMGC